MLEHLYLLLVVQLLHGRASQTIDIDEGFKHTACLGIKGFLYATYGIRQRLIFRKSIKDVPETYGYIYGWDFKKSYLCN
jgi:hypothetical protein